MSGKLYQVVVREDQVPVTAGHLTYDVARQVADDMSYQRHIVAQIVDETTREVVYTIEPFADNVIPLRSGIRPEGVEHGPQRV